MADDSNNENGLPPKLDLRKKVITPLSAKPEEPATITGVDASATPASPAMPSPVQGSTATGNASAPETMRIKIQAEPAPQAATPTAPPTLKKPEDASQGTSKPETPISQLAPAAGSTQSAGSTPAADSTPATSGPRPLMRPTMGPKTIKLKKPIPLGIKRDTPDPAAPPGSKRATSKISLPTDAEALKASAPATPQPIQIPKTPPAPAAAADGETAESGKSDTPIPVVPPQPAPDPKRQTSRISLESVLGSESETGPKTIKLKRPTSNTITVQGMESAEGADSRRKTSGVELPTDAASDDTPETQKKTIKVKRPSVRPSLRTGGSGGSGGSATGGGSSSTMFAPPTQAHAAVDSAHWFFIVTGCAATIITCVLIYVQCAQVLGPNISLTELSYGAPDAELPWPGRITR